MKYLSKIAKRCMMEGENEPTNWQHGFKNLEQPEDERIDSPLRLMRDEKPFRVGDRWYLYVWDERIDDLAVYDFSTDMTIEYDDFQKMVQPRQGLGEKVEMAKAPSKTLKELGLTNHELRGIKAEIISEYLDDIINELSKQTPLSVEKILGLIKGSRSFYKKQSDIYNKK